MSKELKKVLAKLDEELSIFEERDGPLVIFDERYVLLRKKWRRLVRLIKFFERVEKRLYECRRFE